MRLNRVCIEHLAKLVMKCQVDSSAYHVIRVTLDYLLSLFFRYRFPFEKFLTSIRSVLESSKTKRVVTQSHAS